MVKNDKIEMSDIDAQHLYSNLVSFNINPEEVCLGLGIRDVKDPTLVRVHSYVYLSIPHFFRFAEAVNKQIELLIEKGIITRQTAQ